ITLALADKYRRARPEVPISFSAGVDAQNYPDCAALGFTPITTCTDLLRPGGYGRLARYGTTLEERMRAVGAPRLGDFVVRARGRRPALPGGEEPRRSPQDRVAPGPLRLHQLRQVRARLSQRRELRLRDGAAGGGLLAVRGARGGGGRGPRGHLPGRQEAS